MGNISLELQQFTHAIEAGDYEKLDRLLRMNSRLISEAAVLGMHSGLHLAAGLGNLRIVQRLVEAGADVNLFFTPGGTPLIRASSDARLDIMNYLLAKGAELDVTTPLHNPMFSAITNGHVDVARLLLSAGLDPHAIYRVALGNLKNALSFARGRGQGEIEELLLRSGCRMPIEGVDQPIWVSEDYEPPITATAKPNRHEQVIIRMAAEFGPVEPLALQELIPVHKEVHVTINVIRPSDTCPTLTLFTTGMSDRAMSVPKGQEEYQHAELLMHLPADWPLMGNETDATCWPFTWLRQLAYFPHLHETWLGGPRTIISSAEPPVPLGPNTKQTCWLLLADFGGWSPIRLDNGTNVHFYTVTPIYTEERDFEKRHGIVALLQRLQERDCTTVVDVARPNVV